MTWKGKTIRYVVDQVEELSRVLMELGEDGSPKAYYVYGQGLIGRERMGKGIICRIIWICVVVPRC
ncbi:hypothetical protein P4V47_21920 [Brevibacillus laterosporus]|uniref:hypothetical protein n=1 Tax=Brevibacillus laterosporus TaxID=1465 RepID=UPI002E205432|nr:hypothetical protein [Brevibacillus laterosporus]